MNTPRTILLVEYNPQDEMLILRSLRKANLVNQIDVARDGQQALDYLFCQGKDELIDAADQALYEAKHTGRNRVCLASPLGPNHNKR